MSTKRVVVALGHKALGTRLPEQKEATEKAAVAIADLIEEGAEIIISHSNAPQVGMIHTAMNEFGKTHPDYTFAPMSVCSAMSQGYIGYDLQNSIRSELISRGIYKTVSTILTQVVIDPYDDAFAEPVKVIGRILNSEEAEEEERKGNYVTQISDNSYRRIVAAPKPQSIVEIDAISALISAEQVVIAAGGGGIPVMEQATTLKGASAVIEKDLTSGLLAELVDADMLLILTSVEKVSLNYQQPDETLLDTITVEEAAQYIDEKHFAPDSMLPKIQAGISFVSKGNDRKTVITDIANAKAGYLGKAGTVIVS
ncbi:MAG: carbamate kinase [Lachnospiraceae bacterium]